MLSCDNRCYRGVNLSCALYSIFFFAFRNCSILHDASFCPRLRIRPLHVRLPRVFLLKFSLRAPTSFAVEKSFLCIHRSPFFGALIFPVSQKYTLPHKVYVGLFWLTAVVPQVRDTVSCHEAAKGQRCDCYLVQPDLHTLMTYQPRADNRPQKR